MMSTFRGQQGSSILVVEDSPTQAEKLRALLDDAGFAVTVAANGRQAADHLQDHVPDLILTDVVMPEMDGYQLCRLVKGDPALNGVPVILVTTLADPRDVVRGLECGADNFVVKPYESAELLDRIGFALLNRSLARHDEVAAGVEIFLGGERHFITSGRLQILNLLLTTYDTAVTRNNELERARDQLRAANEQLEDRVRQRTAELTAEIAVRRRTELALQGSRAEIAAIFESTPVPTLIVDTTGRVVRANRALTQLANRASLDRLGELPGSVLGCVNAPSGADGCGTGPRCGECPLRRLIAEAVESGQTASNVEVELCLQHCAATTPASFIVSVEVLNGETGRLAVVSLLDISERRAAALRIQALNRLLSTIRDVNQLIVRESDRGRLLAEACRIAVEHGVYELAAIALVDSVSGAAAPVAAAGRTATGPPSALAPEHPARELLARTIAAGTTVVDNDRTDAAGGDDGSSAALAGLRSSLAVPLTARGSIVGAMAVFAISPDAFDGEVVALFEELAGDLGFALGALEIAAERERAVAEIRRLNAVLEQRVRRRTEQLELANRELEAFSYSISHDLRAPLRAILGFSRLLAEARGDDLADDERRYLSLIQGGADEMEGLIGHVLSFSRLTSQPMRVAPVETADLFARVWDDLAEAREGREIELVQGDLPGCAGDPVLLKQVVANLLGNAVKFTRTARQARIEVGGASDGATVTLFVRDNGVGFDAARADKLFGVFQRFHRDEEFEGTGVGLAIVKRIVSRHGGRVWAESAPGEGATFWVSLPCRSEDGP